MTGDGFTAIPRLDLAAPGPQGFDNVLIRRDANGNLEDVLINESKQLTNGTIELISIQGSNNSRCSNCVQMSEEWIDDVLDRMSNTSNPNTVSLGAEISNFRLSNTITRSVSGIDRVTGELVIVKL